MIRQMLNIQQILKAIARFEVEPRLMPLERVTELLYGPTLITFLRRKTKCLWQKIDGFVYCLLTSPPFGEEDRYISAASLESFKRRNRHVLYHPQLNLTIPTYIFGTDVRIAPADMVKVLKDHFAEQTTPGSESNTNLASD